MIRLRLSEPVLHRRRFFQGRSIRGLGIKDISWFDPSGQEMTDEAWSASCARSLGVRLAGDAIDERTERGERVAGHTMLLLLNADAIPISFALPVLPAGRIWEEAPGTANGKSAPLLIKGGDSYELPGHSSAVLVLRREKRRRQADLRIRLVPAQKDEAPAEVGAVMSAQKPNAPVVPAR